MLTLKIKQIDKNYYIIAAVVLLFNLTAIFFPNILQLDDSNSFFRVSQNGFYISGFLKKFLLLSAYRRAIEIQLMHISPYLARFFLVTVYMIPISLAFYYIMKNIIGISKFGAFLSAVLPNIVPTQIQIPVGIISSYPLFGFLMLLLSLICAAKYLNDEEGKKRILFFSILLLFISLQSSSQSFFASPFLVLMILILKSSNKRKLFILVPSLLLMLLSFYIKMVMPRKEALLLSGDIILNRVKISLLNFLSNTEKIASEVHIVFLIMLILLFILSIIWSDRIILKDNAIWHNTKYRIYIISIFFIQCFFAIFPFILFTKVFSSRYLYQFNFFYLTLLILILEPYFSGIKKWIKIIIISVILLLFGIYRHIEIVDKYQFNNYNNKLLEEQIKKSFVNRKIPNNSQFVIFGIEMASHDGVHISNSGNLQFILGKDDVSGLITVDKKYQLYDPFEKQLRTSWSDKFMRNLNIFDPIYIFERHTDGSWKQYNFALQWLDSGKIESEWWLFEFDSLNGTIIDYDNGTGIREYELILDRLSKNGISESDIVWSRKFGK